MIRSTLILSAALLVLASRGSQAQQQQQRQQQQRQQQQQQQGQGQGVRLISTKSSEALQLGWLSAGVITHQRVTTQNQKTHMTPVRIVRASMQGSQGGTLYGLDVVFAEASCTTDEVQIYDFAKLEQCGLQKEARFMRCEIRAFVPTGTNVPQIRPDKCSIASSEDALEPSANANAASKQSQG